MDTTTLIVIVGGAVALALIAWMMLAVFRGRSAGPDAPLWPPVYYFPDRLRNSDAPQTGQLHTPDGPPTGQFRIPTAPTGAPTSRGPAPRAAEAEFAPDATFAALPAAPPAGSPDEDPTNLKKPPAWEDTGTAPTRANPILPRPERSIEDTAKMPKIPRGIVADDKTNVRPHTPDDDRPPNGTNKPPNARR
ncbi:MAG: hypothetical protein IT323_19110 [Anaerolineae bacterium]|nr:hypothetical protein [Anaerolineae bacterium]